MGPRDAHRARWHRLAGVVAGLLAVALAPAATPATAHPGLPSPIFDPDEVGWASFRGLSAAEFGQTVNDYRKAGFILVDMDMDVGDSGPRLAGVFQRNLDGRRWLAETMMTPSQFSELFKLATGRGMRLVDFEVTVGFGQWLYAAIWIDNVEGFLWSFKHGLTAAAAQTYYHEMKDRYLPVDVNLYATAAGDRYAIAWVRNAENLDWRLRFGITGDQLQAEIDTFADTHRPLVIDSALTPAGQRYASIIVANPHQRYGRWHAGLTAQQYANRWNRAADEGLRDINILEYQTSAGTRYAGIWRQNSDRWDWPLRTGLDDAIADELDDLDIPGISVAVMESGQLRYLRGFGHADVADGVWLDGRHVMRLASVSKAVAGVLTMRLAEQGVIDPDQAVAFYVDDLPEHHAFTIEQVMSNRGCVRHHANKEADDGYPVPQAWYDEDQILRTSWYSAAWYAALEFWEGQLAGCTIGDDEHYSTHGYTIGAVALENAAGEDIAPLVVDELTDPYQLGTLRPEDLSDTSVRRTVLYEESNDPVAIPEQVSWKVLGGGMEASVRDLASFGDKLLSEQILTGTSLTTMWEDTPDDHGWSYAYGWNVDTEDGHTRVYKEGNSEGATSYLQLYPDDGITIAVLMNRRDGVDDENRAEELGQLIGAEILATLP